MPSRRTTARGFLLLLLVGVFAGTANAASVPPVTAFPVVGSVFLSDDFGAPRTGGWHQGNDIMAAWRAPVVAFERGRVKLHTGSTIGTCMLYLTGRSGMTYVYIHLNNDLTRKSEDSGGCVQGVAYARGLKTGDRVRRGEYIAHVGDSGDAENGADHLHFEIRRPSGRAIDPYPYLRRAYRLLYPRPADVTKTITLRLRSDVRWVDADSIAVRTRRVRALGMQYRLTRKVTLAVTADTLVERKTASGVVSAELSDAVAGERVTVWTTPFLPTWRSQKAPAGHLVARRILLGR